MGKIHLGRQNSNKLENWVVLEEDVDYIGAMHDGKVSICYTKDIEKAESIPELLHKLQGGEDKWRWYVILDYIDSKHRTRHEEYPYHRELHVLPGVVPHVCDLEIEQSYTCNWKLRYVSELWVALNDYVMVKVSGFDEAMMRERDRYIDYWKLQFEEVTK